MAYNGAKGAKALTLRRLGRGGSPAVARPPGPGSPGPPRSEPATRGFFRKKACFSNLNRASGEKAIHSQQGRRSDMNKKSFPLSRVYGLLEPGPVVLVTTARKGCPNVMTMSWHTMMEFEPPLVGCVVSNRNYSHGLLKAARECVINIPSVEMAETVVGCG